MILSGDEVRRTQAGNNNAYCQDNEVSWFDWTLTDRNRGLLRFFQRMIAFRKAHPALWSGQFFSGETNERGLPDVTWHGCKLHQPGWKDPDSHALAFTLAGFDGDSEIHVILNMYWNALEFEVPEIAGRRWYVAVDTAAEEPDDIAEAGREEPYTGPPLVAAARSVVVLISR